MKAAKVEAFDAILRDIDSQKAEASEKTDRAYKILPALILGASAIAAFSLTKDTDNDQATFTFVLIFFSLLLFTSFLLLVAVSSSRLADFSLDPFEFTEKRTRRYRPGHFEKQLLHQTEEQWLVSAIERYRSNQKALAFSNALHYGAPSIWVAVIAYLILGGLAGAALNFFG